MVIRNMRKSDIPQLAVLYRQFWKEDSNIEKMNEQFDFLLRGDTHILLSAVDDNRLIGSVMGIVCQELYGGCRPFLILENMIVDKKARKKGVGKSLLKKLEEMARLRNCTQIILVTESNRTDACTFYEACGFQLNNMGYKKNYRFNGVASFKSPPNFAKRSFMTHLCVVKRSRLLQSDWFYIILRRLKNKHGKQDAICECV